MELKIYDKDGQLRLTASPNSSSVLSEEVGGECSVSASFTHTAFVLLDVGDWVEVTGVRYKLKSPYRPTQKNTRTYQYTVKFYAPIHDAESTLMLYSADDDTRTEFSYDGGPREHLQLWADNMNRKAGAELWSVGTVISAENKVIDYQNMYCWDAAFGGNGIAATFKTEMWADGYVINLCKAERGERVELGYMRGLTSLAQEENGGVKFFTRLFPLGSTRNIDASKYGHARLQLPSGKVYVDKNTDLYGIHEATEEAAFADIYPKYIGTVSSARSEEKEDEDGKPYTVYYIKDEGMDWNPKDYEIPDLTYMLSFQTGELAGRGNGEGAFEAAWHEDTKEWEIVNVWPDETTQIPGGLIVPEAGDTYIPWNFALPREYVDAAEQAYAEAVDNYLEEYSFDTNKYNGTTDRNYIERNGTPLMPGQNVRLLSSEYFTAGYKDTRVTKLARKLNDLCQATLTCTDEIGKGWKTSVDNRLSDLQYVLAKQRQETRIDIVKTTDTKTPSDWNVFSALRSRAEFISKKFNDTVIGILTFLRTAIFRAGAVFGKNGFASGPAGFGAKVDENGHAEVESLTSRRFIETPELRYNRVDVKVGDKWRAPGAGIIESVDTENKLCTLKLEEGEIGAVAVGDICMGIFHSLTPSDNAAEDTDDSRGNRAFAGFCTVYFTITEVIGDRNQQFKYQIRPASERWKFTFGPFEQMNFVAYGSFTRADRQTSVYETRTYTRMLWKQNTWEIGKANIAKQSGDLSNLNIFGMNLEGYSEYTNSVYFTGEITQVREDGTVVKTANDRTDWEPGDFAAFYDRVSYKGGLWLCVAEDGTNTVPSKDDPAWFLQVKAGDSITSYKRWQSADTPYPYAAIVPFADRVFMAAKETSNPPYPLLKDSDGNYLLVTEDGGKTYHYIITEYTLSEDWTLLLDVSGIKDGADGASLSVRYSSDKANWHEEFREGDVWMRQKLGDGAWSAAMRIVGEAGTNGKDGQWQDYQFAVNSSLTVAPVTGWQDAPPAVGTGQYLWMRTGVVIPPATEPASWVAARIGGEKGNPGNDGTDGVSVKNGGRWKTGLTVEPMTLVTMGGKVFLSKARTSNPPMWTLTDNAGNRLTRRDGSYILTGEMNTGEWDLIVENGADGRDAVIYEYIYRRTDSRSAPATPGTSQADGYVPSGWSATSQGVSENYSYEWRCERKRSSAGIWSDWSSPVLVHSFGRQGIQGCVARDSEWAIGVRYRNDSDLTTNTGIRYIDVALVRNDATATGWDAYQCRKTHVSSSSLTYTNTEYWDKFDANVGAIFTSLVIAKNAKIRFLSGNEITIQKSDGTVTAGMSGSEAGGKIRFWAGGKNPDDAPFRVDEAGNVVANRMAADGAYLRNVRGLTGAFESLTTKNSSGETTGTVAFDNETGRITFEGCDIMHQGTNYLTGKPLRYLTNALSVRGAFGYYKMAVMSLAGATAYYKPYGFSDPTEYTIQMRLSDGIYQATPYPYGTGNAAGVNGSAFNLIMLGGGGKYEFAAIPGCMLHLVNRHKSGAAVQVAVSGGFLTLSGGMCATIVCVDPQFMIPTASGHGAGWLVLNTYQNSW